MRSFFGFLIFTGVIAGGAYFLKWDESHLGPAPTAPFPTKLPPITFEESDSDEALLDGKKLTAKLTSSFGEVESTKPVMEIARFSRIEELELTDSSFRGSNQTHISSNVSYGYTVDLDNSWELDVRGTTLIAYAPQLIPQKPAATNLKIRTKEGWFRFDSQEHQDSAISLLENQLASTSVSPEVLNQAKEIGRANIAQFLKIWIVGAASFGSEIETIKVIYPDETSLAPIKIGSGKLILQNPQ